MKNRTRSKVTQINKKNSGRPILSVFRSNRFITAALIETSGKTISSYSSAKVTDKIAPAAKANKVGLAIAKIAKDNKITEVVFDRNKYRYHGQVKSLAEGAREAGLKF